VACWNQPDLDSDPPTGTFGAITMGTNQLCGLDGSGLAHCFGNDQNNVQNEPSTPFSALGMSAAGACGALVSGGIGCWNPGLGYTPAATGAFTALGMGNHHTCAIRSDRTLACWGQVGVPGVDWGQTVPPSGTFEEVSSGIAGSCARRTDDTVACWGALSTGGGTLTAPTGTFSVIDFRGSYGCGVKTDGALACWGSPPFGIPLTLPSGTFREVSTNGQHVCAIRTNDTVTCFGVFSDFSPIPTGQP
jgi:hypothetical protein